MITLVIVLTVAGYTQYSVYSAPDTLTCDRWGQSMILSGEASSYTCTAKKVG